MKIFTYQGRKLTKPDNVSNNLMKSIINMGGKDEVIPTQMVVDMVSRILLAKEKTEISSNYKLRIMLPNQQSEHE